ncbi:hypothetical protein F3Y22_tig00111356pilonHSYRG00063 [Hibiscus syriacus]|uniref:Uncharacterized protein n=1 Tax=Hibiscus syriacus TaxID=106335 RepID=A0A6A2YNM6_HIBSY|nr:hypothetical protein F3Y22_tig00111356pilonHSYRG00063 [Hibiscus syriacus]
MYASALGCLMVFSENLQGLRLAVAEVAVEWTRWTSRFGMVKARAAARFWCFTWEEAAVASWNIRSEDVDQFYCSSGKIESRRGICSASSEVNIGSGDIDPFHCSSGKIESWEYQIWRRVDSFRCSSGKIELREYQILKRGICSASSEGNIRSRREVIHSAVPQGRLNQGNIRSVDVDPFHCSSGKIESGSYGWPEGLIILLERLTDDLKDLSIMLERLTDGPKDL